MAVCKFSGGFSGILFKLLIKVRKIIESAFKRHLRNIQFSGHKQFAGIPDPQVVDIGRECFPGVFLEIS